MNLESALVIRLRENIRWESALEVSSTGTLQPVNPNAPLNVLHYQQRDRELAFRDLINAAAVVEASVHVSDVWHYKPEAPRMEGATGKQLPHAPAEMGLANSQVRHVKYTSVPADAYSKTDRDLYGRDVLVYDVLARACQLVFQDTSPLVAVSSTGSVPGTQVWSLAEGQAVRADINTALPLDRELFKKPDMNLADRDNQMAGYVSRLVQVIKNPFAYAERLYVSVTGGNDREPEVYVLISESDEERVWSGDPAIEGRNRFVYRPQTNMLEWLPQSADTVHVPQIMALVIPGVLPGQNLNTLAVVPAAKDAQFWRLKAGQLTPAGQNYIDVATLKFTSTDEVVGGITQVVAASLTVPDTLTIRLPISAPLPNGAYRISVLTNPCSTVEIIGAQNISGADGDDGGAEYFVDVASGAILPLSYVVYDGDGVTYNGQAYAPGEAFFGVTGITTYTAINGSKVRQFGVTWNMALAPGSWTFTVDYTNVGEPTTGFGVQASYAENGKSEISLIQDTVALPFRDALGTPLPNGTIVTSPPVNIEVTLPSAFSLPIYWTFGNGQLSIKRLRFTRSDLTETHYVLNGTLPGAATGAAADVRGTANQPDVIVFDYGTVATTTPPVYMTLTLTEELGLPLQVKQVQLQSVGTTAPTPLTENMQGWRQECLERGVRAVQQSYHQMVLLSNGSVPTLNSAGTWDNSASEDYMSLLEVAHPRLRIIEQVGTNTITDGRQYTVRSGIATYAGVNYTTGQYFYGIDTGGTAYSGVAIVDQVGAFKKAAPGHIGRPGIMPLGLKLSDDGVVRVDSAGSLYPVLVTMQAWMIDAGLYSAAPEFWQPDILETSIT